MKRLLKLSAAFIVATLLAITVANCALIYDPDIPKAWKRAKYLARVTQIEEAEWKPKIVTSIVERPRYIPVSPEAGIRLCGQTETFLEGEKPDSLAFTFYVGVFVRSSEDDLKIDVLTHEFLHVIWIERATRDDAFFVENPDSEAWVQSLIPNTCPEW